MRDYTGTTVFLGMDVHKASYSVTAIADGAIVKRDKLPADVFRVIEYCNRYFPNAKIKSAYEAGFSGFELHRILLANGISNIVVHPASIEVMANDRVKNDKRDSVKIAAQLSEGKLKCVHVPTLEQEGRRSISRQRDCLAKEKTRASNRIKGFLYYHGYPVSMKRMSSKFIRTLKEINHIPDLQFSLNQLIEVWEFYDGKIKECDERLKEQAAHDKLEVIYRSAPGIGGTLARVLSNELGDMSQFLSEKDLFSYCGLTPTEHSSGEVIRKGNISRQGKPILRKGLTQAAWVAIRKDKRLREDFERICLKREGKRAIQAIARKLIGRIRACIRTNTLYKIEQEKDLKENVASENLVCTVSG